MRILLECSVCGKTTAVDRLELVDGRWMASCGACGLRVQAPLGGELGPGDGDGDGGGDGATPSSGGEAIPDAPVVPDEGCPKCGRHRDPGADNCPRCGLVFARWVVPEAPFSGHPELKERWAELAAVPPEDPRHDRFLEACFRAGALPDAARAYRALSGDRRPSPAARIRQIQLLSQMQFTPSAPVNRHWHRVVLWVLLGLVLLAALYLWTVTPDDLMR